jgi:hypothetical protein
MERGVSIAVGAGVVALAGLVVWRANANSASRKDAELRAVPPSVVVADAAVSLTQASSATVAPALAPDAAIAPPFSDGPPGTKLPDGTAVPPLPEKAPKMVRFGVVLVTYQGAQGAPANARPKREAFELATKLAQDAKTDFKGAVVRGDSGSIEDIGRVPRGVLEPAPEYVLFTMSAGSVSDPIDTPRGFWIAKRLD